jgi:hypothetical protein
MAGQFGIEKTVVVQQKHFYRPKIRQDVSKYIRSCNSCVISKTTIKNQGLCTPLHTPKRPWNPSRWIHVYPFVHKESNDFVFVVVDWF